MSKLDVIVLNCVNKVLDGNQQTLGDYIDPTKQQIKDLMLELIDSTLADYSVNDTDLATGELRQKVTEL